MGWHNYISNRHNLALIVNIQYYIFIPTYIVKTFVQNDYRVCCLFLDDEKCALKLFLSTKTFPLLMTYSRSCEKEHQKLKGCTVFNRHEHNS